jgi:hypothetical protein
MNFRKRKFTLFSCIRLNEATDCWEWTGPLYPYGYGRVRFNGQKMGVHRLSAHLYLKFPLESPLFVLHRCDNPLCFNPKHLFIGTQKDNISDCVAKGRHPNLRKTHCRRGHPLFGDNVRFSRLGTRRCFTCEKIRHASSQRGR